MAAVSTLTLTNATRTALVGGLFLAPLVPLIVTPSLYYPFVTGKAFAFRAGTEILFGLWLVVLVLDPRCRPGRRRAHLGEWAIPIAGVSFVVALVLSTAFSQNAERSFWSTFERMEGLVTHLHLAAWFVVLGASLRRPVVWFGFLNVSIVVSVIVGAVALWQGAERVEGTFGTPAFLAVYALAHGLAAVWMWLRVRGRTAWAHAYLPVALFQFGVLYATATRGALIALLAGLAAIAVAGRLHQGTRAALRAAAILVGACAILAGTYWWLRDSGLLQESYVLSRFADSLQDTRPTIWRMGLAGARERPILGWGMENYTLVFSRHFPAETGTLVWVDRAHTAPLDWFVSAGIVGVVGYVGLFGAALSCAWRRGAHFTWVDRSMMTGLLVALFTHNLFSSDNLASYLFFVALLAYLDVHCRTDANEPPQSDRTSVVGNRLAAPAIAAIVVATAATVVILNAGPYQAARELALAADPRLGPGRRVTHFERVLAHDTFGTPEACELVATLTAPEVVSSARLTPEFKRRFVELGRKTMVGQAARHTREARPHYVAGLFLLGVGEAEGAIPHLEQARTLAPQLPVVLLALAQAQLQAGQPQALATARYAFNLNPGIPESRLVYALAAVHARDLAGLGVRPCPGKAGHRRWLHPEHRHRRGNRDAPGARERGN